jgi:hypothetical protein
LVNVQNPPKVAKPASTDASAKSSTTLVTSMVSVRLRSRSVAVSVPFGGAGSACRCRTELVGIVRKGWQPDFGIGTTGAAAYALW